MKKLIIAIFLILPGIVWSQELKIDSLKTYPIVNWKLDILLDSYFYDLQQCNNTVVKFSQALDSMKLSINSMDRVIVLRTQERDLKITESQKWENRFNTREAEHKSELKAERKKGRKEGRKQGAILTGIPAIILIIILL